MRISFGNGCCLVLLLVLAQSAVLTNAQNDTLCDPRCKTGVCDNGTICRCAGPGTTLNFLGGEFCNQSAHYCGVAADPTFWCFDNDNNSTCGPVASTCTCHPGYIGSKCDVVGTTCGLGYCYNNGTCLGSTCDCLPSWQGNANCSLASPEHSGSGGSSIKWWVGLIIAGAVVAAVSVGAVYGVKKYKERTEGANRFNELRKSQMRARADSDDEYDSDPYEDEAQATKSPRTTRP